MRITQIQLAGQQDWPAVTLEHLSGHANVVFGPAGRGKSTLAALTAQLLFGSLRRCEDSAGNASAAGAGAVWVTSPEGDFVLHRQRDGSPSGRMTVASSDGKAVDRETMASLLGSPSPRLLAQLYHVDFSRPRSAHELLGGEFAALFSRTQRPSATSSDRRCAVHSPRFDSSAWEGRRSAEVEELFGRRDAVAAEIERHLAQTRRESEATRQELQRLQQQIRQRKERRDAVSQKVRSLEAELAEVEHQLRYFSLEAIGRHALAFDPAKHQRELEELETQIACCRAMLADLQAREATVRRSLAEIHPDGAADGAGGLADQRSTVGVLERLVDDLDGEVAQLARSARSGQCVAQDAHARMLPVAQMLRHQVYALCGQLSEQERAARRTMLSAEARQLSRSQTDLSEQLEHLLDRRGQLLHTQRLAAQPVVALPDAPVADHCRCDNHGAFVTESEAMQLSRGDRGNRQQDLAARKASLLEDLSQARGEFEPLDASIERHEAQWETLQRQRVTGDADQIEQLRSELREIERKIQLQLETDPSAVAGNAEPCRWTASDLLAQLSDGYFQQIRLSASGRDATVIDRHRRTYTIEMLSPAQQDQLYLALTLALVEAQHALGTSMPLLLDEPFLRQDPAAARVMAGVLERCARTGQQVIVWTADLHARRRFESLGATLYDLDRLPAAPVHQTPVAAPTVTASPVASRHTIRVVREAMPDRADRAPSHAPVLRVAGQSSASLDQDQDLQILYLELDGSLEDFPVLGSETAARFAQCDIHCVEQLLAADPGYVAQRLDRADISSETVRLWQTHMSLMCFVPGVSLDDAQVLTAVGIDSPPDLIQADRDELRRRIDQFVTSDPGDRFRHGRSRYTSERLERWQSAARGQRSRYHAASTRFGWSAPVAEKPLEHARRGKRAQRAARAPRGEHPERTQRSEQSTPRSPRPKRKLKFYLQRERPVADAPSIGDKTAERLAKVGIRTVADLLNADAESTAEELNNRHITASLISAWQHQARLVCCIPELRGYGAQILVACGLTDPRQIAEANVQQLQRQVHSFCRTKPGKRILRNGNPPGRDKVAQWVAHAAHMRPLEAA
jgi:energy-coupling factor transporter ATP-binding protein EcfA2